MLIAYNIDILRSSVAREIGANELKTSETWVWAADGRRKKRWPRVLAWTLNGYSVKLFSVVSHNE